MYGSKGFVRHYSFNALTSEIVLSELFERVELCGRDCSVIPKLEQICPEVLLGGSRGSLPKCV